VGFYPAVATVGNTPVPLPVADGGTGQTAVAAALAVLGGLGLQATTGTAGFALQDATPTILTWTAPNDGNMHRVMVFATVTVGSTETGGAIQLHFTLPDGSTGSLTLTAGGTATGHYGVNSPGVVTVEANTAVSVVQSSALTGGSATIFAELWGL